MLFASLASAVIAYSSKLARRYSDKLHYSCPESDEKHCHFGHQIYSATLFPHEECIIMDWMSLPLINYITSATGFFCPQTLCHDIYRLRVTSKRINIKTSFYMCLRHVHSQWPHEIKYEAYSQIELPYLKFISCCRSKYYCRNGERNEKREN